MASSNVSVRGAHKKTTHEGGPASPHLTPLQSLERTLNTCMLFEDTFYEGGVPIADRLKSLVAQCCARGESLSVMDLAINARTNLNLRHAPLLIAIELVRNNSEHARICVSSVIMRADEPAELLSMWKGGTEKRTQSFPKALLKGINDSLPRFDEYQLAKWDRSSRHFKLRDVIRLCHPKPPSPAHSDLWKRAIEGTLSTPDTWETSLSSGADKKETFERLLHEDKLGGLALLRNLRNMVDSGVSPSLITEKLNEHPFKRVLPFRFINADKHAPSLGAPLEAAMLRSSSSFPRLKGSTVLLIDVSGSMQAPISMKSDMQRWEAAAALAIHAREISESPRIFWFDHPGRYWGKPKETRGYGEISSATRGFALRSAIKSHVGGGTDLGNAVRNMPECDRLIIFTDEQSATHVPDRPDIAHRYICNVASYQNGVRYDHFTHVSGFSEQLLTWITATEE